MNTSVTGAEILAKIIREYYDVGDVGVPAPLPAAHQRRHRKLVVKTGAGKFLVKTYKRDPYILDALRFQHRLSDHLQSHGVPVAPVQRAKSGRRIVEISDWALELQKFIEGVPLVRVSSDTIAISSQMLGRFHDVCRDFPRPERDARMWRFSEVPRSAFAKLYERAKVEGEEMIATEYCNRIALLLHEAGRELSWDARSRFETGLIHGDWHGGNLIFRGDELVAVVDFEFAGDGCYLEDLAYAMSNLCVRTTLRPERLAKRTELLLTHYQRFRVLSFAEIAALYYAVGVKHVATVSYQMDQQEGQVAGHSALEWLERLAFQCEWLAEQAKKVRYQS